MSGPKSYMLAVPSEPRDIENLSMFLERLHTTGAFQLVSERMEEDTVFLEINYNGDVYSAEIYPTDFTVPELYRCQHLFPDVDAKAIQASLALPLYWNSAKIPLLPIIFN